MKKEIALIFVFSSLLIGLLAFVLAEDNSGGPIKYGECGDNICDYGENTSSYPYYCPQDCNDLYACTQEVKLCPDGSYVSRNSNNGCKFDDCPETNETIVGSDCGTVTPGYQNECCENKGYDRWDEEEFACIKERKQNGSLIQERNRIRINSSNSSECPENCTCSGSTVKCEFEGGRTMTVYAGKSGNVIVQVKGINASTNVTLYKEDGKIYGNFTGNRTKEIILPDKVMDKLRERHSKRLQLYNESINLTEEGYYLVQTKKKARLFWLVPVKEHMNAEIDAETGEIIKIRNPWWGFLARDTRE